jgi:type II secretory pathway pseudopilin PulG
MNTSLEDVRTPRRGAEEGFTLIEALIAILILVFGLMAIANLYAIAGTSNTVANAGTAAAAAASERMEHLKSLPFDHPQMTAQGNLDENSAANYWEVQTVPGVGEIRTRWLIEDVGTDPSVKFIAVRSEATGAVTGQRSRAEFTTFRSCTVAAVC